MMHELAVESVIIIFWMMRTEIIESYRAKGSLSWLGS